MLIRNYVWILLVSGFLPVSAQIPLLRNREAVEAIATTQDLIYNFEFEKANFRIENHQHGLGEHPANYLTRAILIYWKDRPLVPESETYISYENYLKKAIELSDSYIENEELYEEGIFYTMAGYALLAELYSEEGVGLKVVNAAKKAYRYLKIGKDLKDNFSDFFFSTGLYNYYREKYPELYPFYKSFMWLFARGDKELGIEQLQISEKNGVFTRNESTIYLYHIYLRYENNPRMASPYAAYLADKYPQNLRFTCLLLEVLVSMNDLTRAESLCHKLLEAEKAYYRLSGTLFSGIISERRNQLDEASRLLDESLKILEELRKPDFHYQSMIYATKARVADKKSDNDTARELYKQALKSDPYTPVREEALNYLNK
jgi:hypothetical protein